MPDLDRGDIPHWYDPSAYDRPVEDTCEGYGPAPSCHASVELLPYLRVWFPICLVHGTVGAGQNREQQAWAIADNHVRENEPARSWVGSDSSASPGTSGHTGSLDEATPSCSMCGETSHTERERTDDGEWDEDCVFHPFFDGDGNDLRRPGQAGRPR